MSVYVAFLEARPLPDFKMIAEKVDGMAIRLYVDAVSECDARARIEADMLRQHIELVRYEWCVEDTAVSWDKPNDEVAAECVSDAISSGEVVYGRIDAW